MLGSDVVTTSCVLAVFIVIGAIGNIVALYVFRKSKKQLKPSLYVITLASIDLTASLVTMPFTIAMEVLQFKVKSDIICKLYHFVLSMTIPFSALIMVAISIERYLCICKPLVTIITTFRAKISISLIGLVAVVLGVFSSVNYGTFSHVHLSHFQNMTFDEFTNLVLFENEDRLDTSALQNDTLIMVPANETALSELLALVQECMLNTSTNSTLRQVSPHQANIEVCHNNGLLLGEDFQRTFNIAYSIVFAASCIIVICTYTKLFVFLYHRRVDRRRSRRKQSRQSGRSVKSDYVKKYSDQEFEMSDLMENRGKRRSSTLISINEIETQKSACRNERYNRRRSTGQTGIKLLDLQRRVSFKQAQTVSNTKRRAASLASGRGQCLDMKESSIHRKPSTYQRSCSESITLMLPSSQSNHSIRSFRKGLTGFLSQHLSASTLSNTTECSCPEDNRDDLLKNAKTAALLSLVALVFILSFLPAWLMKLRVISLNIIVFNLYFVHNIANPFIYAFLNPVFRAEMTKLMKNIKCET